DVILTTVCQQNHIGFVPAGCQASVPTSMVRGRSIGCCHRIVREVHVTVRLGPESDAAGHGSWQGERQVEFTIEVTLDLATGNADFEVVPLLAGGRHIADPEYR